MPSLGAASDKSEERIVVKQEILYKVENYVNR